jgi:hypothetical protein
MPLSLPKILDPNRGMTAEKTRPTVSARPIGQTDIILVEEL